MNTEKTGAFLAALRRERGMTQKELAEKLDVTDKAVSRWETGKGLPDISLLKPLADALGVSIADILSGERVEPGQEKEQADSLLLGALSYVKSVSSLLIGIFLLLLGGGLVCAPLFIASAGTLSGLTVVGIALLVLGAVFLCFDRLRGKSTKKRKHPFRLSRLAARVTAFALLLAALLLEILPLGAVLIFAPSPEERVRRTFSFFSLTPVGYANPFPMMAGVATVAVILLVAVGLLINAHNPPVKTAAFIGTLIACVFTVLPAVFHGAERLNLAGIFIFLLLLASAFFQAAANRNPRQTAGQNGPADGLQDRP